MSDAKPSVAEAWAAFDSACVHAWEWHQDVEDAARTLALAVHEETLELLEEVLDDPKYNNALAVARYVLSAVEEQIEGLR